MVGLHKPMAFKTMGQYRPRVFYLCVYRQRNLRRHCGHVGKNGGNMAVMFLVLIHLYPAVVKCSMQRKSPGDRVKVDGRQKDRHVSFIPSNIWRRSPPRCLVVKVYASRAEDPGFKSRLRRDISGSSHTSDLKIGTPVATLPGAWRYRVSAGTGRPGVSIL